jgi:hypothetical protein
LPAFKHKHLGRHKPRTILKVKLGDLGLTPSEAPEDPKDAVHGRLYEDFPSSIQGLRHKHDLYLQNGCTNAVDCIDFAAWGAERSKLTTLSALCVAQSRETLAASSAMKYRVVYSDPSPAVLDTLGDPIGALRAQLGPRLIPTASEGALEDLAQELAAASKSTD